MKSINQLQSGFALIEVMVAMLLLTIGLLSFVFLTVVSLRNDREMLLQTQALQYAESMLDSIRANPVFVPIAYGVTPTAVNCSANACNHRQMALFELAIWKCMLAGPNHTLCASSAANSATVTACSNWLLPDECAALPEGDGQVTVQGRFYNVFVRYANSYSDAEQHEFREVSVRARI